MSNLQPATPYSYNANKQPFLALRTRTKAQSRNVPSTHIDWSRQQTGWFVLDRQSSRKTFKHAALCHFKMNITEADGERSRRRKPFRAFQEPVQRGPFYTSWFPLSHFCSGALLELAFYFTPALMHDKQNGSTSTDVLRT